MATKQKTRRRRRTKREEPVIYDVLVTDWDYYYSISPDDGRGLLGPGPYSEIQNATFLGTISYPENFKYPKCEVTLSGKEGILEERYEKPSKIVGLLNAQEDTLNAYVFIPSARLAEIVGVASSGRIKCISMTGSKLKWRSGTIQHFSVSTRVEDE